MPGNDKVYESMNPLEINEYDELSTREPLQLRPIIQCLMQEEPTPELAKIQAHPHSVFGLYLIACAFHSVLFGIHLSCGFMGIPGSYTALERALDRWKVMWDALQTRRDTQKMAQTGFMLNALEIWWLAKSLIRNPPVMPTVGDISLDSMQNFHAMLEKLKDLEPI
ncbi:hypothetical protein BO71DRAFT_458513 [Aspergillus ellipticus CBS 707.79]|uniref:Transcription factor domain-containing protein n=1 Tax=Aspergillus ellipticus CBS 707.79 TaxID=1448320 RepID=A0A319D417_9EURO|nr:hypothetical protein BO71DRAFT_458513 [Aspergillus ellipticus CBS 707.79]